MRIAFATIYNPADVLRGSGTYYYMSREIERQGHKVYYIGPLDLGGNSVTRLARYISKKLGKRYLSHQDLFVARSIGKEVEYNLARCDYDVLITNDYAIAGYTRSSRPIVLYTDAWFPHNYAENIHPWIANLSKLSVKSSQHITKRGLSNAAIWIFPTYWATKEALSYGVGGNEKARIIPFGANISDPGQDVAAKRSFATLLSIGQLQMLFVGKDWAHKGGEVAIETVRELNRRGINSILHVVGTNPTSPVESEHVRLHGVLNKSLADDWVTLDRLYKTCDLLILPSKAEGFGIVTAEAAAYGLPVLAYDTVGINEAVINGKSGLLIEPGAAAEVFASAIESWFTDHSSYDTLVSGARQHYVNIVNWESSIRQLIQTIEELLERRSNSSRHRLGI